MPIDASKPVTELKWPEFWDISLGSRCVTGKCEYCYASGNPNGKRYTNIVGKVNSFFGSMTPNQRPFQVATGGESEPLEHPDFWEYCAALKNLDIIPNFTTNGVLITERVIPKIQEYCGGVAVTFHEHLELFFHRALKLLLGKGIKVNVHFIVSDIKSIEKLKNIYDMYNGSLDYFVLLKYINVGFAANHPKEVCWSAFESLCDDIYANGNIAFGARFYDWLLAHKKYGCSLYPPEEMSKYLIMDDDMRVCNNSFECKPVQWSSQSGCCI
jgi:sulfatase maturation enzyme AslB (radical SAM superfamily)